MKTVILTTFLIMGSAYCSAPVEEFKKLDQSRFQPIMQQFITTACTVTASETDAFVRTQKAISTDRGDNARFKLHVKKLFSDCTKSMSALLKSHIDKIFAEITEAENKVPSVNVLANLRRFADVDDFPEGIPLMSPSEKGMITADDELADFWVVLAHAIYKPAKFREDQIKMHKLALDGIWKGCLEMKRKAMEE